MPHTTTRHRAGGFRRATTLFLAIGAAFCGRLAPGQTPATVPAGAWEYGAISRIASDGLIAGYPADKTFPGSRTLTRYEFASLVARVLQTAHTAAAGSELRTGLTRDRSAIVRLVAEFKVELAVIGANVSQGLNDVGAPGSPPASPAQPATPAPGFHRTAKFSGLMHTWYGTAFGDTLDGNYSGLKSAPPGRTFGGGGGDTFRLRRLELSVNGTLSPRVDYRVMIDPTLPGAGGILQDMWAGYQLAPRWRIEVGQQKTGLSDDGNAPTSKSIMIEPAIMNTLPVTAGRIGNIRDIGAVARYRGAKVDSFIGIWNGNGTGRDAVATNRQKFLDASFYYKGIKHLTLGLWGGTNVGQVHLAEARDRAGATFHWKSGLKDLEMEIAWARDYAAGAPAPGKTGTSSAGGYITYGHRLSPLWQLGARYDIWNPDAHEGRNGPYDTTENGITLFKANHKLKEYTFGVNYNLPRDHARIMLDLIRDDAEQFAGPFFGKSRTILLSNFQVLF